MRVIWNTKERGKFIFLVFKEKEVYVAVCLNLNIVEYGKNPDKLMKSIEEAAKGHLEVVRKKNLSDEFLNRFAPEKYWRKLGKLQLKTKTKPKISTVTKTRITDDEFNEAVFHHVIRNYSNSLQSPYGKNSKKF